MKYLPLILLFIYNISFSQEKEPELMINLLSNDKIVDVNIDQENFTESLSNILDLCKTNFKEIPQDQKVGILVVVHKEGKPTYEIFSNPKIEDNLKQRTLLALNEVTMENTKLVDFPIFISINSKNKGNITDFKEFLNPVEKKLTDYKEADLKTKIKLNKEYAVNEVLPILSAYQVNVDNKFEGVKNFGKLIQEINFNDSTNTQYLTSLNSNYWRATMEMDIGNQLIPVSKIYMLISQGEFDHARKYIEILGIFSSPDAISTQYLEEINFRISLFFQDLDNEINKGIVEHDKGKYQNAIKIYENILKIYPNSAWALYEKFYSENAKQFKKDEYTLNNRTTWDSIKVEIYKHNPLYSMNIKAKNGEEAYLLFRRQAINRLFGNENELLNDIYEYADIASDLKVYDFAAQLFWLTATFDQENSQNSINNYLYCLEKLGITELKTNFKGDFDKIFKRIDEDKEHKMVNSSIYKSMKK